MKITGIKTESEGDHNKLSGFCDDFELWYQFPNTIVPQARADAFIAACLLPAMALGTDIELEDSALVSQVLLSNIEKLQRYFIHWEEYLGHELKPIKIKGGTLDENTQGLGKTISFFSGGVDGTFTFLNNQQEIDLLLFVKGIDMQLTSHDLFETALMRNTAFAKKKGKPIYAAESNVRFLGHQLANLGWSVCFGGGLASIALAANARKCFIASGVSYKTFYPEGSNFVTDHLWSSDYTEIVHDGAEASRIGKIDVVSRDTDALECFRVCWQDKAFNCGECEKCLRTMAAIRALKLNCPTFPELTDEKIRTQLAKHKIYTPIDYEFVSENLQQAKAVGDSVLVNTLEKMIRNFEFRKLVKQFDRVVFSGRLKKMKSKAS